MKIFINHDSNNKNAIETKERLKKIADNLNIAITNDIDECNIVFSIGGDGTFLKTSRLSDKPIVGINTGTLGYLTEINPENIENTMKNLLNENYHVERRMMLEGKIIRPDGNIIEIPESLNEIAISKNISGVVRFDAIVDDKLINSYTADGILICTPTGSTAYNLSCGGPIVDPTAEIITLTPIAPHTVINRSIILSDNSTIEIKITELRDSTESYVLYDGIPIEIYGGDKIKIKKSDRITKIIKFENRSFIDTIREKIS
ncbi:MAG: NAD(+)/NADH kinase [Methanobrevibacter sp.]|uniref:NAD(+)/NADH kinase n=1 Tax=Methanobrevibacter sp. TaxID=66852 RepID=UPI0025F021FF|nr:NAD(+)/NADH kinase [Methanobrevibacter sp.]MBE6509614.1 NAD(+)/NADH kinase [Methanobrevibacter sp.]